MSVSEVLFRYIFKCGGVVDYLNAYVSLANGVLDTLGKLGWPIAAGFIAWMFRRELKTLSDRVENAHGPGFNFSFGKTMNQTIALAGQVAQSSAGSEPSSPATVGEHTAAGFGRAAQRGPEGTSAAEGIAQLISPAERVDNAWNDVYWLLRDLYLSDPKAGGIEPTNTTLMFTRLAQSNILSQAQFQLVRNLYAMRNFAHRNGAEITVSTAEDYEQVSRDLSLSLGMRGPMSP